MKRALLFLFVLMVSVYTMGQKFQVVAANMSDEGTPAAAFMMGSSDPGVNPNPETDYMAAWVLPLMGSSSANTRCPGNTYRYQETEYLITPAEMLASGFPVGATIDDISWAVLTAGATSQTGTLNIWLMNTTDVTYSLPTTGFTTTGFTLVHTNPTFTVPIAVGTYTIPFSGGSPFTYTGGGVYVAWNFSNPLGTLGTTALVCNCNSSSSPTLTLYGGRNSTGFPTTLGGSAFRPSTGFGNNFYTDILSMGNIYNLERAPIPFGAPVPVGVRVLNNSAAPATFDVTLTIRDATNTIVRHTSTQTVTALAANSATIVNFTWTPTIQEDINITAEAAPAPGENFIINNIISQVGSVNGNLYSYNYATVTTGAVGWNVGSEGIFASRFEMNGGGMITGANIIIGNSATCTGNTVYAVVLNKQGQIVAQSADHVILATELGVSVNFPFPSPPSIGPEEFYVGLGVVPAPAIFYAMGYFPESPTRPNTFFRFELGGSPPSGISGYKFGIDAQVAPFTGVLYPRNFTAASAGATQIDLSWLQNANGNPVMVAFNTTNSFGTPTNGTPYPVSSVIPGGGTVIFNASGTSFNHTGLTAGTTYYYKAWSVDGSTVYSSGVYTTEATYYPVTYTQDFEVTTILPTSWSGNMAVEALHGNAASKGMTFDLYDDPNYHFCTGVSPHIVLPVDQCKLSFDYRLTDWVSGVYPGPAKVMAAGDKVEVQMSTNHGASWTTLYTIDMSTHVTSQAFVTKTVNLPLYTGQAMFRFYGTWGAGDYYVDIDNFVVELLPLCPAPTALTVGSITTTSASIGWTGPAVVVLDYGTPGHTAGTGTIINPVVTNPYTLTPLAPGTSYDVYLRQECGAGIYSAWAGPLSFSTVPLLNITPNPYGFGTINVGLSSASQVFTIQNNGAGSMLIDAFVLEGVDATEFTLTDGSVYPKTLGPGASYTVSVVFHPTSLGAKVANLKLTENETDHVVPLTGTGACSVPTALTATGLTTTSANLGWTANGSVAWEIEWGAAGFTQGTGTMITAGVTNPYALTGLTANTAYAFYVRAVCTPGIYSAWAGPLAFTTPCNPTAAPISEDFELVTFPPTCWSRTTEAQQWFRTTAASGYGIGTASAIANFYAYASAAPFHLMTLPFDASALYNPVLKFDYAYATYIDEVDQLNLYYSTNGGNTFTLLEAMPGGLTGILNTGGALGTANFIPAANQWATHTIALPAGTNMVRFTGISAYGNNLFIDNVQIQGSVPEFLTVDGTVPAGPAVCYNATNTITVGGTNAFTVQSGANVTLIAGQKISIMPGTTAANGSYFHGYISTTYCTAPASPVFTASTGQEASASSLEHANFSIYPNPTNGNFTLVQKGDRQFGNVKVEIYSMRGEKVMTSSLIGAKQQEFATSTLPVGLYFVKVIADDYTETIKLIKTR